VVRGDGTSVPILVLGLLFEMRNFSALTPTGFAMFAYIFVVAMGIRYLTWFATLGHLPLALASTGMLLIPLIAVISGAVIVGEPLG
jgi:drug/metabolite transporter (DMT)-like permease